MNTNFTEKDENMHIGHNIKRIREIRGIKQEALGQMCRGRYSQQRISDFENMVALDDSLLAELSSALGVTPDFVKDFRDENVIYNIQNNSNTFHDNAVDHSTNSSQHTQPTIHHGSDDKMMALLERFLEEDRVKTQSIAELSKAVLDLTLEVKKLKEER